MKFDFLVVAGNYAKRKHWIAFYEKLVRAFERHGYSAGVITGSYRIHSWMQAVGIFSVCLTSEIAVPSQLNSQSLTQKCRHIEKKYDLVSMRDFCFPDYARMEGSEEYLIRKALVYFDWLEKFLDEHQVSCVVQNQGGEIHRRAIYHIAKQRSIPNIYFGGHPQFNDRIPLHSHELKWLEDYEFISWGEMRPDEQKWMDGYLADFKNKKKVIRYDASVRPSFDSVRAKVNENIVERIRYNVQYKDWERLNITSKRRLIKSWWQASGKFYSKFVAHEHINDELYFFFPFNLPNDSQLTIRNTQFYDQVGLATLVSRSLPQGYKLYVKEHPGNYLPIQDKIRLLKCSNIVLLDPSLNAHDIIKRSKGVIIIGSSVGFEALHYLKPVIVLGNWVLKGYGFTIDVDNLFALRRAIQSALSKQYDENEVKAFIFSIWKSLYEGNIYNKNLDFNYVVDSLAKKADKVRRGEIASRERLMK